MRSEFKGRKKWRWEGLKILAIGCLMGFLAWRLTNQSWRELVFPQPVFAPLLISIVLLFVNQYCEWQKWRLTARNLYPDTIAVRKAFRDGITAGFITPNGWGNFLGRMIWFGRRDRIYIVLASLLASFSQLLPTLIFGSIAALLSPEIPFVPAIIACMLTFFVVIVYFFGEWMLPGKLLRNPTLRHARQMVQQLGGLRPQLLGWSVFRYLVFSTQYLLLFMAFGYDDWRTILPGVWLVFLLTSFVPSLWSGKVVIRETAALFVFAESDIAVSHIIAITLLIWVLNHLVPVTISGFFALPSFKKKCHVVD